MSRTWLESMAKVAKALMPTALWRWSRAFATALVTPIRFSLLTGHWKSSLRQSACSASGAPIPWYTYPAIDFLAQRAFDDKNVLEFGGGQSTRWWAERAKSVLTIEENEAWYKSLRETAAPNVALRYIPVDHATRSIEDVRRVVAANGIGRFDVIVIDGHLRRELVKLAFEVLAPRGAILLDNAEGYGFYEEIRDRDCGRADFFGFAPGVSKRHCTSLVFVGDCFLLDAKTPIPAIEDIMG